MTEHFERLLIARDLNESCYLSKNAWDEIDHEIVYILNDYLKFYYIKGWMTWKDMGNDFITHFRER